MNNIFLNTIKSPLFFLIALLLNIAIFMLIQQLVTNNQGFNVKLENINLVEFIRFEKKQDEIKKEQEKLEPEKPEPEKEPPPPELPKPEINKPQNINMEMSLPEIDVPMSMSGTPYLGDFMKSTKSTPIGNSVKPEIDLDVVPTLRVPPAYPPRALRRGIEGIVTVEFTITTDGSVKDAVIIVSDPPNIFDRAVLKAITKWKFDPDIVDGKAIEKRARQDVKFKLQK